MYGHIDYIGTQASTKNPQTPTREERKKIPGDKYKTLIWIKYLQENNKK
jgi:hypothetical protein